VPAEDFAAGDFVTSLQERARHWPWAMNATSTHDTKRSEDARHRLYALADAPGLWRAYYEDARRLNQKFNPGLRGATEHFLYQAILAIWPLEGGPDAAFRQRIAGYMRKACREARLETDWLAPDEAYEARLDRFIAQILAHGPFLDRTTRLMEKLMPWGALASLSVQCLKILSPGVPDFYQGTEIWDFSLVDPDNRRPVDYARRQALAEELALLEKAEGRKALSARLCRVWKDGAVKLWLTRRLLRIRAGRLLPAAPPWPLSPLAAEGDMARALIAYEIGDLFVLCPRYPGLLWPEALSGAPLRVPPRRWGDTRVRMPERAQGKALVNLITGEMAAGSAGFAVSGLLANFPVAVLAAGNE
jgi:(1->4)-alpha-D-glucan 1-alpha-D-glucosylmutase